MIHTRATPSWTRAPRCCLRRQPRSNERTPPSGKLKESGNTFIAGMTRYVRYLWRSCPDNRSPRTKNRGVFMNADIFLRDREVERLRRLACAALSAAERTRMLGLMAVEEDKFVNPATSVPLKIAASLASRYVPKSYVAPRVGFSVTTLERAAIEPERLPRSVACALPNAPRAAE